MTFTEFLDMIIRLCSYDAGTTTKEYFGYDSKGNITAENKVINVDGQTASTAVSKTFRYGINNQLTNYTDNNQTAANNSAYSMSLGILPFYFPNFIKYDDDGNIISMPLNGETAVLEYDAFNNLTSCADMKYTYDIESNRIKTQDKNKTTTYLYDTTSAVPRILESTTDGKTTIYVYGRELISEATSENSRYYHYDYQGNTSVLTGNSSDTQSLNRYTYCKGNPVKYTDPSGMSPEVKAQKQAELEKEKREKVHNVFDAAGMLPFIGGIFDATNGLIYWAEGDGEGVGLTAMAFLPVAGIISTPAKHADDIAEVSVKYGSELAENVLKESDEIGGVVERVGKVDNYKKMTEIFLPDKYSNLNKIIQNGYQSPNSRQTYARLGNASHEIETSVVISDDFGRLKYRIDYLTHGNDFAHTNPYIRKFVGNTAKEAYQIQKFRYFVDESTGGIRLGKANNNGTYN
ncbi:MAG: hypothetical protein Q4F95_04050 [Oscillospiraceae bacterium]|nr:hypothetical protein [Oscillospiraceae bacterium]